MITFRAFILVFILSMQTSASQSRVTTLVNPFVGTDGHGHTFPGATVPFGMVQLSPDTRTEGWDACGGYHYSDTTLLGFSHTHLSGTGVADYGDILFLPTVGEPVFGGNELFSHSNERASPGYYSVDLLRSRVKVELTASKRVGVHRYTFPQTTRANILIDLVHGLGPDRVIDSRIEVVNDREVAGFRRSDGWAHDQRVYFVARFSRPFKNTVPPDTEKIFPTVKVAHGESVRVCLEFPSSDNEAIIVTVALSSASVEGARKNLEAEVPDFDFDRVRRDAESAWERELSKIQISGGTREQQRTFYTALYHSMIAPNVLSDVDGQYRGMDGKIHTANGFEMYTVFSLWDTFRALHPLLTILDRKRTLDFVQSLLAKYDESGVLPVWELASNETWCMIGYHSVPVIVDAYAKGIRGFDEKKALTAMTSGGNRDQFGLKFYRTYGFIPSELEGESVSKTLEYSYDDWCIAQFAKATGGKQEFADFSERSQYWKNVFDPSTSTMRGKQNGAWVEPYDPTSVNINYTEANAWQYSFFVPHAIDELMQAQGGKKKFERNLDTLFFGGSGMSGRVQSDITGMIGQYAQGNEPSHHVAYLYNYAGVPWKTQSLVRRVLDSLYTDAPDGLCGNDDCGQMSAWYVFNAMGFYPVTPGSPNYLIGTPLFDTVKIQLENGKTFTIAARNNSRENKFIRSATFNGKKFDRLYFTHETLTQGGTLEFSMGKEPSSSFGLSADALPKQEQFQSIATVPVVSPAKKSFKDSVMVSLSSNQPGASLYYRVAANTEKQLPLLKGEGRGEVASSKDSKSTFSRYSSPFTLTKSGLVTAYSELPGRVRSRTVEALFVSAKPVGRVWLNTGYASQYSGGGDEALVDGIVGGTDFRLGGWQGYEGVDCDAVIDLNDSKQLSEISLGCLQDQNAWIFLPKQVEYSFSDDGVTFSHLTIVKSNIQPTELNAVRVEFGTPVSVKARYVRVQARTLGVCPAWHKGAGSKCWVFVDEARIK